MGRWAARILAISFRGECPDDGGPIAAMPKPSEAPAAAVALYSDEQFKQNANNTQRKVLRSSVITQHRMLDTLSTRCRLGLYHGRYEDGRRMLYPICCGNVFQLH